MKYSTTLFIAISFGALLLFTGCKQSMIISDVNYSQPIETVLIPDKNGVVQDVQHGLQFNVLPLQYAELQDTSSVKIDEVRMIRGQEGYYYITATDFKHVYVMTPEKNKLVLEKKLKVNEQGLSEPAFNQRSSYIELLNRGNDETYSVTSEEIKRTDNSGSKEEAR